MKKKFLLIATSTIAISFSALSGVAFAQADTATDDAKMEIEEILVTATRRNVSAQKVPISLGVISGVTLEKSAMFDVRDVLRTLPNVSYTQFRATEPTVFIRGIGTVLNSMGLDRPVGIYVDDVYQGRAAAGLISLVDIERLEVLRGPQGTLFGRNVTGGALSYVTKDPAENSNYRLAATAGDHDQTRLQTYFSGPLTDRVSANIGIEFDQRDGFARNLSTGDELENNESIAVRGKFLVDLSPDTSLKLAYDYYDRDSAGQSRVPIVNNGFGTVTALDPPRSHTQHAGFGAGAQDLRSWGLSAILDKELGSTHLKSISAYREFDAREKMMASPSNLFPIAVDHTPNSKQFSQELRFSKAKGNMDLVYGLFLFGEDVVDINDVLIGGALNILTHSDVETRSAAAYLDALYNVSDTIRLGGGIRMTNDRRKLDHTINAGGNIAEVRLSDSWTEPTGRIILEWSPTENVFGYVSFNRSYKAGGYDTIANNPAALDVIDPETVDSIELGVKSDWLKNRLRLNVAFFSATIEDYQLSTLADPANGTIRTDNAGDTETSGFELEVIAQPTDWLRLEAAYGYTDANFSSDIIVDVSGTNLNGLELPRTPKNSYSLGVNLDFRAIDASIQYSHTDSVFGEANNNLLQLIPEFDVVNANVGWTSHSQNWEVRAWALNLADEDIILQIGATGGGPGAVYAPPRTYGITVTFRN